MSSERASFAARVICLYLDDPDTPDMPSTADWDIANRLDEQGISFDTIQLAFHLAFIRRQNHPSDTPLPPIRSLAYFRTVALNLTPEERDPAYVQYVRQLYDHLRTSPPQASHNNRGEKPKPRGLP